MLETLYFYALAHQADFDVAWPRASIAESIFAPLIERIKAAGGQLLGGQVTANRIPIARCFTVQRPPSSLVSLSSYDFNCH